jgi:hypothetical protein
MKILFTFDTKLFILIRRSTVLGLSLQLVFPGEAKWFETIGEGSMSTLLGPAANVVVNNWASPFN